MQSREETPKNSRILQPFQELFAREVEYFGQLAQTTLNPFEGVTPQEKQGLIVRFQRTYRLFNGKFEDVKIDKKTTESRQKQQGIFNYFLSIPIEFLKELRLLGTIAAVVEIPAVVMWEFIKQRKNLAQKVAAGILFAPLLLPIWGIVLALVVAEQLILSLALPLVKDLVIPALSVAATLAVFPFVVLTHVMVNLKHGIASLLQKKDLSLQKDEDDQNNGTHGRVQKLMGGALASTNKPMNDSHLQGKEEEVNKRESTQATEPFNSPVLPVDFASPAKTLKR